MWKTSVQSLKYGGARLGQIVYFCEELLRRKEKKIISGAFEHNFCSGSGNLNEPIFKSSKPGGAWGGF